MIRRPGASATGFRSAIVVVVVEIVVVVAFLVVELLVIEVVVEFGLIRLVLRVLVGVLVEIVELIVRFTIRGEISRRVSERHGQFGHGLEGAFDPAARGRRPESADVRFRVAEDDKALVGGTVFHFEPVGRVVEIALEPLVVADVAVLGVLLKRRCGILLESLGFGFGTGTFTGHAGRNPPATRIRYDPDPEESPRGSGKPTKR